jgi:hypothetical protein
MLLKMFKNKGLVGKYDFSKFIALYTDKEYYLSRTHLS